MLYRISIIGGSGSGKTTLSNILSQSLNLPAIHLDGINFKSNWKKIDNSIRDKIILEEIKKDKWIIDGNYLNTADERFKRSDLIIFLDYSTITLLCGIFKRFFALHNHERVEIPGCKEKISFQLIKYVLTFHKRKKTIILEKLKNIPNEKILIFKNRKVLNEWLKNGIIIN